MNKIKIIIAEDHKLVREGIKSLLKKDQEFEVIAEAQNGLELIEILNDHDPDVVLVDITMPQMTGIEVISRMKVKKPYLKFIILTMHEEPEYILTGLQSGTQGFLLKNVEFEELRTAIKTVAAGGKFFHSSISNIALENLHKIREEQVNLTPREKEILSEVANGLSTKLISDKLSISPRTVETHRVNIMKKLNASNTAELVKIAVENDLI